MGGLQNMMKQFTSGGMPGMGGVSANAETGSATRASAIQLWHSFDLRSFLSARVFVCVLRPQAGGMDMDALQQMMGGMGGMPGMGGGGRR